MLKLKAPRDSCGRLHSDLEQTWELAKGVRISVALSNA
jgi:hypothetical protein